MANPSLDLARAIRRIIENVVKDDGSYITRENELAQALANWGNALVQEIATETTRRLQAGQ